MTLTLKQIDEFERTAVLVYEDNGLHVGKGNLEALCQLARERLTPAPQGQYDDLVRRLLDSFDDVDVNAMRDEAAAAIRDLQQQVREAPNRALDEAAEIIRRYAIGDSADGPILHERYDGDVHAMAYADAILALKDKAP